MITRVCLLSTVDNPFDPYDDFNNWFQFDIEHGYNTCGKLARLTNISTDATQREIDIETERAIDSLIEHDFLGIFKKVVKEFAVTDETAQ